MPGMSHALGRVPKSLVGQPLVRAYAIALAGGVPLLCAAYALPDSRRSLSFEGGVLETASVAVYLVAFAAALLAATRRKTPSAVPFAWVVPVLAVVAIAEELSWGEDLFGWRMPVVYGIEIEALNDLLDLAVELLADAGGVVALVLGSAVLGAVLYVLGRHGSALRGAPSLVREHLPLTFVAVWTVLVPLSIAADKATDLSPHMIFLEEVIDLYAALALMFAGLALLGPAGRARSTSGADSSLG
jgi:hypothetical protein